MLKNKLILISAAFALGLLIFSGCSALKQIASSIENAQRLKFKLGAVNNFRLAGINISNKSSIKDVSVSDAFKLTNAFATKKFPADFILNVDAMNPNSNTANSGSTNTNSTAKLTGFEWRLLIDDIPTIYGNIAEPVTIPGNGQTVAIPLSVSLDLYEFFGSQGYDRIANLAMAIGGVNGSSSRIKLDAKPTVTIGTFPITYPGRITIVNTEFRDK